MSAKTTLSKTKIKQLLTMGALWIWETPTKKKRLKRAKTVLKKGDRLELFYDPDLEYKPGLCFPIFERHHWGIWFKPASFPSQGTLYSDKISLEYEIQLKAPKAHLLSRLDFEVQGLVLSSYNAKSHKVFQEMLNKHEIKKFYIAECLGVIAADQFDIDGPIDEKVAKTRVEVLERRENSTLVKVELLTGRTHQIRKHFEFIGHPLLGDPKYGKNNKNQTGLHLCAYELVLNDPYQQGASARSFKVPKEHWPTFMLEASREF